MKKTKVRLPLRKSGLVRQAREALKKIPEIDAAYLYGSFLTRNDYEDVDFALLLSRKSEKKWDSIASRAGGQLNKIFRKECDVHVAQELPDHVKFRVIRDGQTLVSRNPVKRIRFEAKVLTDFLDYRSTYNRFNDRILKRDLPW